MIRTGLLKNVLKELSSHPYLAQEDFSLTEFGNKSQEPCLAIKYRPNSKFFFNFHIPKERRKPSQDSSSLRYLFSCTMSPGRESVEESDTVEERDHLLTEIREWLKRLYEDIVSAPVIRQFEAQSTIIEQLRERLENLPDEPLSREDVMQFREELDQIKIDLTEQLKKETSSRDELKRRADELSRDIAFLKQTLESMTKRQWGEVFFVRARKWTQRFSLSLRPLAAGTRLIKGVLPEGIDEALDKVADTADEIAAFVEKIPSLGEHSNEQVDVLQPPAK